MSMDVICVTNRKLCKGDFLKQIRTIAQAKPKYIILREKDMTNDEYVCLARKVIEICNSTETKLICNTFIEAAEAVKAHGIHLPLSLAEKSTYTTKPLGISVHSLEDAIKATNLGADYIIYGHIFATDCKKGLEPRGVESLQNICSTVNTPVYAIGGITPENATLAKSAGAAGVCLMSSLMQSDNPQKIIAMIKQL